MRSVTRSPDSVLLVGIPILVAVSCGQPASAGAGEESPRAPDSAAAEAGAGLAITGISAFHSAAEAYFSPDGTRMILNAQMTDQDDSYHVYTIGVDGSDVQLINDQGFDACSFYFPDGERVLFTSTRDNLHLPPGDYSKASDYPTGAELYSAELDGSDVRRLTNNEYYDAEASVSPDGEWILFSRQIDGRVDLWRMRPDGSGPLQITHTPEWQEGGAFYMPDGETILFRAWKRADQDERSTPMALFTIQHDGTELRQLTDASGTNWAPYPSPDGRHCVFVKVLPPHNYELFLLDLETLEQTRLTFDDAFDGFPAFSPDGRTIGFSSSRGAEQGSRSLSIYLMDVGSLASISPAQR